MPLQIINDSYYMLVTQYSPSNTAYLLPSLTDSCKPCSFIFLFGDLSYCGPTNLWQSPQESLETVLVAPAQGPLVVQRWMHLCCLHYHHHFQDTIASPASSLVQQNRGTGLPYSTKVLLLTQEDKTACLKLCIALTCSYAMHWASAPVE